MWKVSVIENTLKLNSKIAKEIYEESQLSQDGLWDSEDDVLEDKKLFFNEDHFEHVDYFTHKKAASYLIKILKKHKISGQVLFGSLDGDQFGKFWGYNFSNGKMNKVKGKLVWK